MPAIEQHPDYPVLAAELANFRESLRRGYVDPERAEERISRSIATAGNDRTRTLLRENPERFGTVADRASIESAARIGPPLYEKWAAMNDDAVARSAIQTTRHDAHSHDSANTISHNPSRFAQGSQLDNAHTNHDDRLTAFHRRLRDGTPTLPASRAETQQITAGLPQQVADRLSAFTETFRDRLRSAYTQPDTAELKWRELIGRRDIYAAQEAVLATPTVLGPLTANPYARGWARQAAHLGAEAHHLLAATDNEISATRQIARGDTARRSMVSPPLAAQIDQIASKFGVSPRTPPTTMRSVTTGITPPESIAHPSTTIARTAPHSPSPSTPGDPAIDNAIQKLDTFVEAENLATRSSELSKSVIDAKRALHQLDHSETALTDTVARWENTMNTVYQNPTAAIAAYRTRATIDEPTAVETLRTNPTDFGPLKTTPRPGIAGRIGLRDTRDALAAVPASADLAAALPQLRENAEKARSWINPDGQTVRGSAEVREALNRFIGDAPHEFAAMQHRNTSLGGLHRSHDAARDAIGNLTPNQVSTLGKATRGTPLAAKIAPLQTAYVAAQRSVSMGISMAEGGGR